MKKMRGLFVLALTCVLCGVAGCSDRLPEPSAGDIQSARRAANEFQQDLHNRLLSRLERGDPEMSVYLAYRSDAREMMAARAFSNGVEMKRTAFRVRNPANRPDDWEYEQMEMLAYSMEAGLAPSNLSFSEVVRTDDDRLMFRWIRPVVMEETCLPCHGDGIDIAVLDRLAIDYPDDEATGYFQYELGGAISVSKYLD